MEIDKIRAKQLIDFIMLHLTLYERRGNKGELKIVYQKLDELREEINMPGWISVFKGKPKDNEVVEVCDEREPLYVQIVKYSSLFDEKNDFIQLVLNRKITHWRSIKDKG